MPPQELPGGKRRPLQELLGGERRPLQELLRTWQGERVTNSLCLPQPVLLAPILLPLQEHRPWP